MIGVLVIQKKIEYIYLQYAPFFVLCVKKPIRHTWYKAFTRLNCLIWIRIEQIILDDCLYICSCLCLWVVVRIEWSNFILFNAKFSTNETLSRIEEDDGAREPSEEKRKKKRERKRKIWKEKKEDVVVVCVHTHTHTP